MNLAPLRMKDPGRGMDSHRYVSASVQEIAVREARSARGLTPPGVGAEDLAPTGIHS
jgi:hypothetical protein